MEKIEDQLKLVGWLNIANGAIALLMAAVIATVLGGVGILSGEVEVFAMLSGIGGLIALFIGLLSVPSILGGWGILHRKPWARILVLILGFLNLFSFPIGTLIGGFSVYVLLKDEAKRLFEGGGAWPEPRYDALPAHDDELARFDEQLARMREAQRSDVPRAY